MAGKIFTSYTFKTILCKMVRDQQEIRESKESFDNTIILQPKEETNTMKDISQCKRKHTTINDLLYKSKCKTQVLIPSLVQCQGSIKLCQNLIWTDSP